MKNQQLEEWRDIVGWEGYYQISTAGRVKSLIYNGCPRKTILKIQLESKGYLYVKLIRGGKAHHRRIHRLVLEAFVGPRPVGSEGRHLDGNKHNNHPSNLKWGTHSENMQDRIKHGTHFQPDNRGSKHGKAKLTDVEIEKIRHLFIMGISQKQIARQFHVRPNTISDIATGKTWKQIKQ